MGLQCYLQCDKSLALLVIKRLVSCFIPPYHLSTWHTSCMYYWITHKILTGGILMVSQYMLTEQYSYSKCKNWNVLLHWNWPLTLTSRQGKGWCPNTILSIWPWPSTVTNKNSLGMVKVGLHTKNQGQRSNCSNKIGWKLGRMGTAKSIIPLLR